MKDVRKLLATAGLGLIAMAAGSATCRAQSSVAFAPTIGTIPDGVILNVTPVAPDPVKLIEQLKDWTS